MSLQRLSVRAAAGAVDAVCEALEALGASAVSIEAGGDEQVLEPAPGASPLWRANRISALFPEDVDPDVLAQRVNAALAPFDVGIPELALLEDQDWATAWRQQTVARCFGQGLWVLPHDEPLPCGVDTVVRLDPGLAFGTGSHATTALCLEWLAGEDLAGATVLDLGCGSGILAIAAARKGARRVLAVDHDEQALEAAASNARRNEVASVVEVSADLPDEGIDVVLANILANTLVDLAPRISACHRPGGALVLSGILEAQVNSVWEAYRSAYGSRTIAYQEGWAAVSAVRTAVQ